MPILLSLALLLLPAPAYSQDAALRIGNKVFRIDIAVTPQERAKGLMHRREMAEDYGMLFIYPEPRPVAFWMKETHIPLDILFFDSDGRLTNLYRHAPPCTAAPCPLYRSRGAAAYVLELRGGSAAELGLEPGKRFDIVAPEQLP